MLEMTDVPDTEGFRFVRARNGGVYPAGEQQRNGKFFTLISDEEAAAYFKHNGGNLKKLGLDHINVPAPRKGRAPRKKAEDDEVKAALKELEG